MFKPYVRLLNQIECHQVERVIELAEACIEADGQFLFLGNGGSNAICSHIAQDFFKNNFQALAFSDPAMLTCFANDYGWTQAYREWLGRHYHFGSLVFLISSSGASDNILAAADIVSSLDLVTLSGFHPHNELRKLGRINFWVDSFSYGEVECVHQIILHTILDQLVERRRRHDG